MLSSKEILIFFFSSSKRKLLLSKFKVSVHFKKSYKDCQLIAQSSALGDNQRAYFRSVGAKAFF